MQATLDRLESQDNDDGIRVLINGELTTIDPRAWHERSSLTPLGLSHTGASHSASRALDLLLTILFAPVLLALVLIISMLVRVTSPGPIFYRQVRIGRNGRRFTSFKFRSMHVNAEAQTGPLWASVGADPRVTRVGLLLRRLGLDSLPQVFNVLSGEMSLVGPRAERPEYLPQIANAYGDYFPNVLALRPGMFGLGNLYFLLNSEKHFSPFPRVMLDLYYAKSASAFLNLKILIAYLLVGCGARSLASRLLRLEFLVALNREPLQEISSTRAPETNVDSRALPTTTPDAVIFSTLVVSLIVAAASCFLSQDFDMFPTLLGALFGIHTAGWLFVEGLSSRRGYIFRGAAYAAGSVILWEVVLMLSIVTRGAH